MCVVFWQAVLVHNPSELRPSMGGVTAPGRSPTMLPKTAHLDPAGHSHTRVTARGMTGLPGG